MSELTPSHQKPYPFANCPVVPREYIGTPKVLDALREPFVLEINRMAARAGLRPGKLTPATLSRLLPRLPEIVLEGILRDDEVEGLSPASAKKARRNVAKKFKDDQFRRILANSGVWRKRRLFVEPGGKPVSLVSWVPEWTSADMAADFLVEHARVAAGWGMEMTIRRPFWYHGPLARGVELHIAGRSILTHGEVEPRFILQHPEY